MSDTPLLVAPKRCLQLRAPALRTFAFDHLSIDLVWMMLPRLVPILKAA